MLHVAAFRHRLRQGLAALAATTVYVVESWEDRKVPLRERWEDWPERLSGD
jgi:hypothetical protein